MEQMMFVNPPAVEVPPSTSRSPIPSPPTKPLTVSKVSPSQGREREVQQLIRDLAVLAARHKGTAL